MSSAPNIAGEINADSRTWRIVDAYWQGRLIALRQQLEGNLSETDTAATRGAIREAKAFLNATRPSGVPSAGSPQNAHGPVSY